jgi:hypothetical protein
VVSAPQLSISNLSDEHPAPGSKHPSAKLDACRGGWQLLTVVQKSARPQLLSTATGRVIVEEKTCRNSDGSNIFRFLSDSQAFGKFNRSFVKVPADLFFQPPHDTPF